jgi:hypothetical protein
MEQPDGCSELEKLCAKWIEEYKQRKGIEPWETDVT